MTIFLLCDPAVAAATAKSLQSCLTLYDPIVSSPPGSSIPGILQARTLEWVAIYTDPYTAPIQTHTQPIYTSYTDPYIAPIQTHTGGWNKMKQTFQVKGWRTTHSGKGGV